MNAVGRPRAASRRAPALRGFAPVIDARARLLVLGSFPGAASLAAGHYYAHPRNQFWTILGAALDEPLLELDFDARYQRVRAHGIAIWDVLAACDRAGSLDSDIRRPVANRFERLRALAPELRAVLFNGRTAGRFESLFVESGYLTQVLPSTSPAYAGLRADDKLARWREAIRQCANLG